MSQPSNVLAYLAKDCDLEGCNRPNAVADVDSNQVVDARRHCIFYEPIATDIMTKRIILSVELVRNEYEPV